MTELVSIARTFNVRPSSLVHGLSSYEAYCFDSAATIYVMELSKQDDKKAPVSEDASTWL